MSVSFLVLFLDPAIGGRQAAWYSTFFDVGGIVGTYSIFRYHSNYYSLSLVIWQEV